MYPECIIILEEKTIDTEEQITDRHILIAKFLIGIDLSPQIQSYIRINGEWDRARFLFAYASA